MYKTLGFKWLFETSCPASAFVSADSDEARNPQRFIHVNVRAQLREAFKCRVERERVGETSGNGN